MTDSRPLPLEKIHQAAQAVFRDYEGWRVPDHYGRPESEYEDILSNVAVVDFSYFTTIRVTGKERADYLNRRLSQKIIDLREGMGRRATLLDAVGRMLADMEIFADGDAFHMISPPRRGDNLAAELEKYVFTEDCRFEDITDRTVVLGLLGPRLGELLKAHGVQAPAADRRLSAQVFGEVRNVRIIRSDYVPGGLLLIGPSQELHSLMGCTLQAVEDCGGHPAGFQAFEASRTAQGCPWWGRDLDNETIPLEADLLCAIHEGKGCYPGQETIARIRNLGHPTRKLVRLEIDAQEAPSPGAQLFASDDTVAGHVTSAARLSTMDKAVALAMVKWPWRDVGTEFSVPLSGCLVGRAVVVAPCACAAGAT